MFSISDYLKKFKNLTPPESSIKQAVVISIDSALGVELDASDIEINRNKIYLKAHPAIKSEVSIKKENIIKNINERIGKKAVFDIY